MAEDAASLAVEDSKIATTTRGKCHICQRVVSVLHAETSDLRTETDEWGNDHVPLSSWEELRSNQNCSTCSRITASFKIRLKEHDTHSATYWYLMIEIDWRPGVLALSPLPVSPFHAVKIYLTSLDKSPSGDVGVIMNPYWLDLERVSQWIKACDTGDADCCFAPKVPPALVSSQDMFCISISQSCLVKADRGERYIALSYVWGPQMSQFGATRALLPMLTREGSLSDPKFWDRLPGTIQRAMQLTSLLEVDLLWVDRLCIVQDDPVHTASQVNNMASVYSNAYLTLCAADGSDAESGLQGIPRTSKPRNLQQDIFAFHSHQLTSKYTAWKFDERVAYDERAWTLQESVLPRRILTFRNNGVQWNCLRMSCQEQALRIGPPSSIDPFIRHPRNQWPSLYRWAVLVFDYQKRRITYEHDILRAFSGLMDAMSEYMPGGFHFGLPELFFDMALLWTPSEHLTRREGAAIENSGFVLPSWSWAGWRGDLSGAFVDLERDYLYRTLAELRTVQCGRFDTCVDWFKIKMDTSDQVKVCNDYDRYRDSGLRGDVELQPGWSWHFDEYSNQCYEYDMAERENFRYPLPTIRHPRLADAHTYQSILFCRAQKVYLGLGSALSRAEQDRSADGRSPVHWVTTEDGSWAGVLYVHRFEDSAKSKRQCELVAISSHSYNESNEDVVRDWSPFYSPEMIYCQRPRSGDWYHFYYCLWIEWQNGIAYRKGLARVAKSVYDELPKEEIDLYLG